ncbi:MAG TPA: hypothetical protein DCM87_15965 [Planctomycetes bacterium]|nr:hypothetical protein [Planctomycetota bacterium]
MMKTRTALPVRDWRLYDEKCRAAHRRALERLTPRRALALCEEMRHFVSCLPRDAGASARARARWEEKLTLRMRMRAAFARLDQIRNERRDSTHIG